MSDFVYWALALFLLTLLAGFGLLKTGKPYRSGMFNLHKLLALAAAVLGIYMLLKMSLEIPPAVVISTLLVILLFASGASLSIGKPDHPAILIGHRVAAILAAAWVTLLVYAYANGIP